MKNDHHISILILILALLGLTLSCEDKTTPEERTAEELRYFNLYLAAHYPDAVRQPSGIYYLENRAGTGASPDADDWLLINYVCYTIPGDDIYETYVENVAIDNRLYEEGTLYGPFKFQNGSGVTGLQEGLKIMKEGEQATILFTSDLGYGASGKGSDVSPYESLKFEVELLEVIPDIVAYEDSRFQEYVQGLTDADTIYDPETESVMYYLIEETTEGDPVVTDSVIEVAYKGYLLDGRVFDERTADDPYEMTVGQKSITGWDLGLPRLRVGEKARFVIPYPLAYGETGKYSDETGLRQMPPYETLLFDLEVLSQKAASGSEE